MYCVNQTIEIGTSHSRGSIGAIDLLQQSTALRDRLMEHTTYFREAIEKAGFDLLLGEHPIVPIMLGEAALAQDFAARLLKEGIYVIGFFYPAVPKGKARIRVQLSASHSRNDLDKAIQAFVKIGKALKVI